MSFWDLVQEGSIGLMHALDKFDVNKGCKFSTIAQRIIDQHMDLAIYNNSGNIRLPVHLHQKLFLYNNTVSRLQSALNREPSEVEIAEELTKEFARKFKKKHKISVDEVEKLKRIEKNTISLNYILDEEEQDEFDSLLPASELTPEDIIIEEMMIEGVQRLLSNGKLTAQEKEMITLRYGLSGMEPMTLESAGKHLGIKPSTFQAREKKILIKLRSSLEAKKLAGYVRH